MCINPRLVEFPRVFHILDGILYAKEKMYCMASRSRPGNTHLAFSTKLYLVFAFALYVDGLQQIKYASSPMPFLTVLIIVDVF